MDVACLHQTDTMLYVLQDADSLDSLLHLNLDCKGYVSGHASFLLIDKAFVSTNQCIKQPHNRSRS